MIDLLAATEWQLRQIRWSQIAVVMQSAMNALNPVFRIGAQLTDVLRAHRPEMSRAERHERAAELLRMVGITRTGFERIRTSCPAGCGSAP